MSDEGKFGHGGGKNPDAWGGRPRGPYGTNEGDIWLGVDSEVGRMLKERQGTTLIHEVMMKDGKLQDCIYHTKDQELIDMATRGHEHWVAAQAVNN